MMLQRPSLAIALLVGLLAAFLSDDALAQDAVRLTGVPDELHFPLPAGKNVVLTAEIEKQEPRSVWLAKEKDSRLRCLLSRVGAGRYQVNLADHEVAAVLAAGGDSFRVFAELPDGTVISSIVVRYAAAPRLHAPPRVYVLTDGLRREVLEGPDDPFLEPALRARLTGQSIVVTADGVKELRARAGEKGSHWCSPETVQGLEFEFPKDAVEPAAEVRAGDKAFSAEASGGPGALRIAFPADLRRAWEELGSIDVVCTEAGEEISRLTFFKPPSQLDLPRDGVELTITQRTSKAVPGSQGYEAIYIDDITGGQVRLSLATAGGERLIDERSVREGDTLAFATRDALYTLTVKKLANFLIGDDYAIFTVSRASEEMEEAEQGKISGLIEVLANEAMVLRADGTDHTAAQVAAVLREERKRGSGTAPTLEQFIDRVASRSPETGKRYWLHRDRNLVPASAWMRELASAPVRPAGKVAAARAHPWAEAIDKPGLPNLHRVGKNLYRGAQPTAAGIAELKAMGVKTIVNLRSMHSDRDLLGDTGLSYVEISCHAWHPEEEDVIAFLETVSDETKGPFFVHCQHGADRTGMMVAIYRVVCEGWSKASAIEEMTEGGFGFHPLWRGLPAYVRELDVEAIRRKAGIKAPAESGAERGASDR